MSKKMVLSILTFIMFTGTVHAAPGETLNKAKATMEATASHPRDIEVIESFKKEYDKHSGDLNKMDANAKFEFGRAVKALTSEVPGMNSNGMMRLILTEDVSTADFFANVMRLKQASQGSPEQQKASKLQIELLNLSGARLTAKNMNTKEFKALRVLLSLDLLTLPKAMPFVEKVVKNLQEGQPVDKAVNDGMAGIHGTMDDFLNACGKKA